MYRCETCGEFIHSDGFIINIYGDIATHKCQPCWLIRHDDNSIEMFFPTTLPDNFTVYRRYAYDVKDAAKKVAEELFGDKDEEWTESILDENNGVTFLVVRESNKDAKPIRVCVTGFKKTIFDATIVDD